ncbi:MerR family transcriptional regulator [Rapidithrix thailandica]|uniref:MerR family transcriptional regulator n=1 Tax=Rapidithrix thailandica TaxID=413964 RepID=A0AAW9S0N7_9BACT
MAIEKKYYSIGEVAEQFDVAPSLIRFWESQFDMIRPKKNKNGVRQYTRGDIEKLQTIYHLVKEKGYTLQGAKELLRSKPQVENKIEMINSLKKVKAFLEDLQKSLDKD